MIERALKLGAKTYDGTGDLETAYLWLDRVSEIYAVRGCLDPLFRGLDGSQGQGLVGGH